MGRLKDFTQKIREGWDSWFIAMFKYGDELQRSRQMLHRFFQVSKVEDYYDVQTHSKIGRAHV